MAGLHTYTVCMCMYVSARVFMMLKDVWDSIFMNVDALFFLTIISLDLGPNQVYINDLVLMLIIAFLGNNETKLEKCVPDDHIFMIAY